MNRRITQLRINNRLVILIIIIIFLFVCLLCRLFYIQVIDSTRLITLANSQWFRDLPLVADRGDIVDVNNTILVQSNTTYTLYARPAELNITDDYTIRLSEILKIDYETLQKKLSKKGVSEITVAKNLTKEQMIAIVSLDINGMYITSSSERYYPYGNFLTQVLGFVSSDNVGQNGIELKYDEYLSGINGAIYNQSDIIGRKVQNSQTTYLDSQKGMTTHLTIDAQIQSFVERAAYEAYKKYDAESCSCIMVNANTGAVVAMTSQPTYDLNDLPRNDIELLNKGSKNVLISNVYEPGSTFKILTSAIGIEENKIKSSYYCNGGYTVDGDRIKCWKTIGHGSQSFKEGIKNSCNCVFMDIALSVGVSTMYDYFDIFGITTKTNIDLKGEVSSILLKEKNVKNVDIARIGFGQAIAITPIQLIMAVSSVVNGGKLYTPYVVDYIDSKGKLSYVHSKEYVTTISKSTSDILKEYLYAVVDEGGGKNAKVEGYKIGGKTGTAQKYENGVIARGKYISSFIGFTTIDNEDYVCLFLVDEPKGYSYYGSIVAAPYVGKIFNNIFNYKNVPRSDYSVEEFIMPDLLDLSIAEASAILKNNGIEYEFTGDKGTVVYQVPAAGSIVNKNIVAFFAAQ